MTASPGPGRSQAIDRGLRVLGGVGLLATLVLVALVADGSRRVEVLGWEGAFLAAVVVVLVWNLLPGRDRRGAKFSRGTLMVATFTVITIVGGGFVPKLIEHKTSTRDWVLVPILLVALFIGYIVTERRGDERVEQELREWRRRRGSVRPKSR